MIDVEDGSKYRNVNHNGDGYVEKREVGHETLNDEGRREGRWWLIHHYFSGHSLITLT